MPGGVAGDAEQLPPRPYADQILHLSDEDEVGRLEVLVHFKVGR
jgi:hypothetical protein